MAHPHRVCERSLFLYVVTVIGLMLTACSQDAGTPSGISTNATSVDTSSLSGPTRAPSGQSVAPGAAAPGSQAGTTSCPALATVAVPPAPKVVQDAPDAILELLNRGASSSVIVSALTQWGMTSTTANAIGVSVPVTSAKVLPGDASQLIVVLYDARVKDQSVRFGDVLVFGCASGQFEIEYRASDDAIFGGQVANPHILAVRDVTGDGIADVAFVSGVCSPSACTQNVTIASHVADSPGLVNVSADIDGGPKPVVSFIPSKRDASQALVIAYGTLSDVSVGPQRPFTDTWMFASGAYTLTASVNAPAVYRVHALQDADTAFRHKAYADAAAFYQRVISDPSLRAWDGPSALADERSVLGAFSQFRLAELAAVQGNMAGAQTAIRALQAGAKLGSPAGIYARMAAEFGKGLSDSGDYANACDNLVYFSERNQATYRQLGGDVFGSANYDYQPEDMCIKP